MLGGGTDTSVRAQATGGFGGYARGGRHLRALAKLHNAGRMTEFTSDEKDIIRRGALGALSLVAQADPGFIALFKESAAGSRALAGAPDSIKDLLTGGLVTPPQATSQEGLKTAMLADLSKAAGVLGRDPESLAAFRNVVHAAVQAVAEASKGASANEQSAIAEVLAALDAPGGAVAPPEVCPTEPTPATPEAPPATDGGLTMDPST